MVVLVTNKLPPLFNALALLYHLYEVTVPEPGSTSTFNELAPEQMDCDDDVGCIRNVGSSVTVIVPVALTVPQPPVNGML